VVAGILDETLALPIKDRIEEAAPLIAQINDAVATNTASGVDSRPVLSAAAPRVFRFANDAMESIGSERRAAVLAGADPATVEEFVYVEAIKLIMQQYLDSLDKLIAAKTRERSTSRPVVVPMWVNPYLTRSRW
jgi:hypothetical protein